MPSFLRDDLRELCQQSTLGQHRLVMGAPHKGGREVYGQPVRCREMLVLQAVLFVVAGVQHIWGQLTTVIS